MTLYNASPMVQTFFDSSTLQLDTVVTVGQKFTTGPALNFPGKGSLGVSTYGYVSRMVSIKSLFAARHRNPKGPRIQLTGSSGPNTVM